MSNSNETSHPMHDPAVKSLLQRMEPHIAESFSVEQLMALGRVVGLRGGRLHSVDLRATIKLPFVPWSFYVVLLTGRNRRTLTAKEKSIAAGTLLLFITLTFMLLSLLGIVIIYLLKSWLGIDIFQGFSLGLYDWFRSS